MSSDEKYDKKKPLVNSDKEGEGGETGTGSSGGQSGKIEFRDFVTSRADMRDDLLPFDEKKRLLSTHKDLNESKVKQQKEKRDHYKDLKNGKIPLAVHRAGLMGGGMNAQFKANPILANKAQFSGIDRQVNSLPTENLAETNQDARDELMNELKYRLGYEARPTFNPKPHGPG